MAFCLQWKTNFLITSTSKRAVDDLFWCYWKKPLKKNICFCWTWPQIPRFAELEIWDWARPLPHFRTMLSVDLRFMLCPRFFTRKEILSRLWWKESLGCSQSRKWKQKGGAMQTLEKIKASREISGIFQILPLIVKLAAARHQRRWTEDRKSADLAQRSWGIKAERWRLEEEAIFFSPKCDFNTKLKIILPIIIKL